MTPEEIIPDCEVEHVHAYANFGSMGKREVVDESITKVSRGLHIGSTARHILLDHQLVKLSRNRHKLLMTPKGRKYLKAITA